MAMYRIVDGDGEVVSSAFEATREEAETELALFVDACAKGHRKVDLPDGRWRLSTAADAQGLRVEEVVPARILGWRR